MRKVGWKEMYNTLKRIFVIVHPFFPEVKRVISLHVDIEPKLYQSRSSLARSMSSDRLNKEFKRVTFLQPTSSCNGQQPGGQNSAIITSVAKAYLAPLNGRSYPSFRYIIGGFDPFMKYKGKKIIEPFEQFTRQIFNTLLL